MTNQLLLPNDLADSFRRTEFPTDQSNEALVLWSKPAVIAAKSNQQLKPIQSFNHKLIRKMPTLFGKQNQHAFASVCLSGVLHWAFLGSVRSLQQNRRAVFCEFVSCSFACYVSYDFLKFSNSIYSQQSTVLKTHPTFLQDADRRCSSGGLQTSPRNANRSLQIQCGFTLSYRTEFAV